MNKRKFNNFDENEILITDIAGLCKMLSVGKSTAKKIADLAEANVNLPFTKLTRYNVEKIKDFIKQNSF